MENTESIDKIQFIRDNIDNMTWPEMSKQLVVGIWKLHKLAADNNISKTHKQITSADLEYLRLNIDKKTWKQLCKKFHYSQQALSAICAKNNISKVPNKTLSNNDVDTIRKNINLKSWPELSKMFDFSTTYLKEFCNKHGIIKEKWAAEKIKRRIETTRTFNKNWTIEGGTDGNKRGLMIAKWKNKNGPLKDKHMLVFENGLNTFEDLIEIPKSSFTTFNKKRGVRIREKQWASKQILVNGKYVTPTLGNIAIIEKNNNKVPVRIDHKTIRFMDVDKCDKNEFNQWVLKTKKDS